MPDTATSPALRNHADANTNTNTNATLPINKNNEKSNSTAPPSAPQNTLTPPNSDYIQPHDRRLGVHAHAGVSPSSAPDPADPVKFQLRKLVGLLISTGKDSPKYSGEFLQEVTELTTQFMGYFVDSLHKLTEVQRHHKPGIADLAMCLEAQNVSPSDLYLEYQRTLSATKQTRLYAGRISSDLHTLLREFGASNYTLEKDDPSLVFHANEQHEIASLVPRQATSRDYIPAYLPELPPDFTFTSTGNYVQTTTDLKEIKLRLAEQSRLNEASLYNLIDDDERRWRAQLEQELEVLDPLEETAPSEETEPSELAVPLEVTEPSEGKDSTAAAPLAPSEGKDSTLLAPSAPSDPSDPLVPLVPLVPPKNPKAFDFVAYAQKRRRARERYAAEMQRRRTLRHQNIFMKAEAVFSPYATAPPTRQDKLHFDEILASSFTRVIRATRLAEKRKAQKQSQREAERKRREQEQQEQSGAVEFGFSFNPASGLSDDDSDSEDEHVRFETSKEYDFGDATDDCGASGDASGVPDREKSAGSEGSAESAESGVKNESRQGQMAWKAPVKTVAPSEATGMADEDEGNSDMEDVLDSHFGYNESGNANANGNGKEEDYGEVGDAGDAMKFEFDDFGMDENDSDSDEDVPRSTASGKYPYAAMDASSATPQAVKETPARVSWGDLSEESEEDELEDVE